MIERGECPPLYHFVNLKNSYMYCVFSIRGIVVGNPSNAFNDFLYNEPTVSLLSIGSNSCSCVVK